MIVTDRTTLEALLVGHTHYIAMTPGKEAAIFYRTATEAHMALPDGARLAGRWSVTPTGYHVDWTHGPSADWQLDVVPGRIAYLDAGGIERVTVDEGNAGGEPPLPSRPNQRAHGVMASLKHRQQRVSQVTRSPRDEHVM